LKPNSDNELEDIYQRIKGSVDEIVSVVPCDSCSELSPDDILLFNSIKKLIHGSELVIAPPMIFDDEDGIYKFRDIYFSRIIMPGDNGPPDFKSLQVQQINKLEENEVIEKKRNWLIETKLLEEMLSDDPCERTIQELQSMLGAGYESPYLPVPKPDGN